MKNYYSNGSNRRQTISLSKQPRCYHGLSRLVMVALMLLSVDMPARVTSEEAPAGLDMGALASLASNLGSNPQLMSMVSSFLNADNSQKPGQGPMGVSEVVANQEVGAATQDVSAQANTIQSNAARLSPTGDLARRGARQQQQDQAATAAAAAAAPMTPAAPPAQAAPASTSGTLSSIVSMLPSVLPSLNLGSLGGLGSLLGATNKQPPGEPPAIPAAQAVAASAAAAPVAPAAAPPRLAPIAASPAAQATASAPGQTSQSSAQSVINQVLTAYAAGQIPNELIQLSLSGRIPPQIIELALSGQVPPQMIQMIITGQVPMSTINAFLNTFQQVTEQPSRSSRGPTYSAEGNVQGGQSAPGPSNSPPGVFSTTRALFEAMFGLRRDANGKASFSVPTLVGPIPLKMPSIGSNVRNFGQLVGGTITNMASMLPF